MANDLARDAARLLVAEGYAGLITGATFHSELTHLGVGFFANVGATAEVVEEHRGRLGLPPVFMHAARSAGSSWRPAPSSTSACCWPRGPPVAQPPRAPVVARDRHGRAPATRPWSPRSPGRLVAARPRPGRPTAAPAGSAGWPSAAILVAGLLDLLMPSPRPLRGRLHLVLQELPLRATVAAGALVALAGLALIASAGASCGASAGPGGWPWCCWPAPWSSTSRRRRLRGVVLALAILVLLLVNRREFQAASADRPSLRSAVLALVRRGGGHHRAGRRSIELFAHVGRCTAHHRLPWWTASWPSAERLVGVETVALPDRADRFLAPTLLAIGLGLVAAIALFLVTRPVVDRRLTVRAGRRVPGPGHRAPPRDLHARLLRPPRRQAVVLPPGQPGGLRRLRRRLPGLPRPHRPAERAEQVWDAFRRFADGHGWVPAVMGAGEELAARLPEAGMRNVYIGDEAVVDVQHFSLAGGR